MGRNDPLQVIKQGTYQYQLVVRTFIPFKTYAGFLGDDRSFSTSQSATYRSGLFLVFDVERGKLTEKPVGVSTGTGRSRSGHFTHAKVRTRLKSFHGDRGRVMLEAHMEANDPYPFVEKLSPDIDTDIAFTAFLRKGNLFVAGEVIGDAFPSTEVFIRDSSRAGQMLLTFATPHGASGAVRLFGVGTKNLGKFAKGIKLNEDGRFIRLIPWHGEEEEENSERLAYIKMAAYESPLIPGDALFDFDSARLKPSADAVLSRWVDVLNRRTQERVVITGHTDSLGDEQYNVGLSLRRAMAVQDWFVKRKVRGANNFVTSGKGEKEPVATNQAAEGRQQNRRVEIRFK